MFKSLSILQWTLFWLLSNVIFVIQNRYVDIPNILFIDIEASILGRFYWAGLTTVILTWLVYQAVKMTFRYFKERKLKHNKVNEVNPNA